MGLDQVSFKVSSCVWAGFQHCKPEKLTKEWKKNETNSKDLVDYSSYAQHNENVDKIKIWGSPVPSIKMTAWTLVSSVG